MKNNLVVILFCLIFSLMALKGMAQTSLQSANASQAPVPANSNKMTATTSLQSSQPSVSEQSNLYPQLSQSGAPTTNAASPSSPVSASSIISSPEQIQTVPVTAPTLYTLTDLLHRGYVIGVKNFPPNFNAKEGIAKVIIWKNSVNNGPSDFWQGLLLSDNTIKIIARIPTPGNRQLLITGWLYGLLR